MLPKKHPTDRSSRVSDLAVAIGLSSALHPNAGPRLSGNLPPDARLSGRICFEEDSMDGLIYLVGLVVVIMAILSFFGLH